MRILKLKENDINGYSKLSRKIIIKSPYYSDFAKKICIKDFSSKKIKEDLKDKNILLAMAKEGKEIVGFIRGFFDGGKDSGIFWLQWIGVDIKRQGKGIADKMLDYLENKLKDSYGAHKIVCVIRPQNNVSIALFSNNKFRKVTLLKKHWFREDFLLWEKSI